MSIPTMPERIWDRIKELDPIEGGEQNGCWNINGDIRVLFNDDNVWDLRAWEEDPPKPPQGTMQDGWDSIKGGTLDEENVITKDGVAWRILHEEGSEEEPGRAVPEEV